MKLGLSMSSKTSHLIHRFFYHFLLWKTPNCLEIYPDEELCISTLIFSLIFHILPFGEVKNKSELSMLL